VNGRVVFSLDASKPIVRDFLFRVPGYHPSRKRGRKWGNTSQAYVIYLDYPIME